MKKYNIISYIMISAFITALVSCDGSNKSDHEEEVEVLPDDIVELRDDQIVLANIETGTIAFRSLSGTLKASGMVTSAPQNMAMVCMPMGGFVKSTAFMPGNAVSKGQTLAVIENQEFIDMQQNYLEAKSKFEYAEAEFHRQEELYRNEVSSEKSMQQVTSEYRNLKAQVKALEQKLSLIGINPAGLHEDDISSSVALVSPISGYIKAVNVNLGKFVVPSDVLFEIINSDRLFLELTLFEKDANKVSAGQKISFFINNETEQHEAVIYQTGKSVNADKTYNVYANIRGVCKNVLPGMYVNALIEAPGNTVPALPSDAVVSFDDRYYIFVFDRNKEEDGKPFTEYRMVEVKKGIDDEGYTEVILPEGFDLKTAKIVIKGAYNLLSAKKNAGEMAC